jgi:hypothetical protein
VLAESIDKATGGKYSDKISAVTSKLEERLDPDKPVTPAAPTVPAATLDPDQPTSTPPATEPVVKLDPDAHTA